MNKHIGESDASVGHNPSSVGRMLNISGQFAQSGRSLLNRPAQQLAAIMLTYDSTGFIFAAGDVPSIELFAAEVAPQRVNSSQQNSRMCTLTTEKPSAILLPYAVRKIRRIA